MEEAKRENKMSHNHMYFVWVAYDTVTEWMSPVVDYTTAKRLADEHNDGCHEQGGFGSAKVFRLDENRYLVKENGDNVWPPHGRSTGAVKVTEEV